MDPSVAEFEPTPFGRRRKPILRPAAIVTLGLLGGLGGLACWWWL